MFAASLVLAVLAVHAADVVAPTPVISETPRPIRLQTPMQLGAEPLHQDTESRRRAELERSRRGPDSRIVEMLGLPRPLKPVEQLVGDRNVLSTSTRILHPDIEAAPIGFKGLYEAPDDSGQLVRGNGGLFATFPYSAYHRTKKAIKVDTPPGTLFHIGMPLAWRAAPPQPQPPAQLRAGQSGGRIDGSIDGRVAGRIDLRLDLYRGDPASFDASARTRTTSPPRVSDVPTRLATVDETALPRISSDESYRRAFLAALRTKNRMPVSAPVRPTT